MSENAAAGQFDNAVEESEASPTLGVFGNSTYSVAAAPIQDGTSWDQVSNDYAHEGGGKKRKSQHSARLPALTAGDTNGVFQSRPAGDTNGSFQFVHQLDSHNAVAQLARQPLPSALSPIIDPFTPSVFANYALIIAGRRCYFWALGH